VIRILLLGLVLAGVWYLYRMVTQAKPSAAPIAPAQPEAAMPPPEPETAGPEAAAPEAETTAAPKAEGAAVAEAEEMIECPLCSAYVPETAQDGCGRPDCPIPTLAAARTAPGA
jgi:hypothetical protein